MRPHALVIVLLAAIVSGSPASGEETARQRLAMHLAGAAGSLVGGGAPRIEAIRTAIMFAEEVVALDPDRTDHWRMLADLAVLGERNDLYERAITEIARLDPYDDVARLKRINIAIERQDRVEDRLESYRRLLAPERRDAIGAAVASRLSFDLALLHQRLGDIDAFAEALADAVAIDPSNRSAAAVAAGFFRMNVSDPAAEAELLINLLLADPTDVTAQTALGQLFLENGAYLGASRLYGMASENIAAASSAATGNLLADRCIALWASGQRDAALRVIRKRQKALDEYAQETAWRDDPDLDPMDRAAIRGVQAPTLATVRAAIHVETDDPEAAASVAQAIDAYEHEIEGWPGRPLPTVEQQRRLALEMTWVIAWLGSAPERIEKELAQLERSGPVADGARRVFAAWVALRRGELERAVELFEALPEREAPSLVGLAEAQLALGRRKDAARSYLEAARAQPGTLIGVWAANRLAEILDQRVVIDDDAKRLEALAKTIPPYFDRYPQSPSLAVGLQVEPVKTLFSPFEPIVLNLRISNNSPRPLAIDRDGPIRPFVVLMFDTTVQHIGASPPEPVVIDIARRLRLDPYEQLDIPVDLRRYQLGDVVTSNAPRGVFIRVKAVLNFVASSRGALQPALLGAENRSTVFRVDGERVTPQWVTAASEALEDPFDEGDLTLIALFLQVGSMTLSAEAPAQMFQVQDMMRNAVAAAFEKLDGYSQAWLLGITPVGHLPPQLREVALRSDDRLVQLLYVMFHLSGPEDPMIDQALSSDDERLRLLAERSLAAYRNVKERLRLQSRPGLER